MVILTVKIWPQKKMTAKKIERQAYRGTRGTKSPCLKRTNSRDCNLTRRCCALGRVLDNIGGLGLQVGDNNEHEDPVKRRVVLVER